MEFFETDFLQNEEIKLTVDHLTEGNPEKNWVPAYHFNICDLYGNVMGKCDLRVGYSDRLYYGGHIGYTVNEEYRGNRYAAKACKLLFSLAKKHGMDYVYITCVPENIASKKTCESLNGEFLGIKELPEDNDMRISQGKTHVCVFKYTFE